jgi:hypothetical protein
MGNKQKISHIKNIFKINGKPLRFYLDDQTFKQITKELDKMPFGDLIHTGEFLKRFNLSISGGIAYNKAKELFDGYWCIYAGKIVWGSKKTIASFKETIGI